MLQVELTTGDFGTTAGGEEVKVFRLENKRGTVATIMNYGATLISLELPDRDGLARNCVLGYDSLVEYEHGKSYFGATVGRYAGAINGNSFVLDGARYDVTSDSIGRHAFGDTSGLSHRVWLAVPRTSNDGVGVVLQTTSAAGDQGYPGNLRVKISYHLSVNNELRIDYAAMTDSPTHVNLTNHSYFNLAGHDSGSIRDHELVLYCGHFLVVDDHGVPTGEIRRVEGTPFDFTKSKKIGAGSRGRPTEYNHSFVTHRERPGLSLIAVASDPSSGRTLEILTTEPSVHLYTASHLQNEKGADHSIYQADQGFCLNTQHFPDTPHRPEFPSTVLRPGETYFSSTAYRFMIQ